VKPRIVRLVVSTFVLTMGLWGYSTPAHSNVLSTPSFELDPTNPLSLATSGAAVWKDLVSGGTLTGTLSGDAAYNSAGGGSLSVTGSGMGGSYFPAASSGSATNPSGAMTVMMWVKISSWNSFITGWNIFASRWFINTAGNSDSNSSDWHFGIYNTGAGDNKNFLNLYTSGLSSGVTETSTAIVLNKWQLIGFTISTANELQFYLNGRAIGPLRTGATHNSSTTAILSVGDVRSPSGPYGFNGNIGRFRIWNTALSSAAIKHDFNNEAGPLGYTPTTSLSFASNSPVYRVLDTITASVVPAGKVTFYERGKVIPGCKNIASLGGSALCKWKPSVHGQSAVTATYAPIIDTGTLTASMSTALPVARRATSR